MDLEFSEEERAFREEVRTFLAEQLPTEIREATAATATVFVEKDVALAWQSILHKQGWAAPHWPVDHGGTGWTPIQRYIFEKECAVAGAPKLVPLGLNYVGPVVFTFGSDSQKDFYLPRILSGEDYWCQGFSEPGAGSDLASLKCGAVLDGEHYVVNGTKMWTTHAHFANRMFTLVRTSKEDRKQAGISFLLIDMTLPGVTVAPIPTLAGDHEVNQVFLEDVHVPAVDLVGDEGKGWSYAKFLLEFERGGIIFSCALLKRIERLKRIAQDQPDGAGGTLINDAAFAEKIAWAEMEARTLEITELRAISQLAAGQNPGSFSSVVKTIAAELEQEINALTVDALGPDALPYFAERPLDPLMFGDNSLPVPGYAPVVVPTHLNARAATIFGGSSEVQRDIIARTVMR